MPGDELLRKIDRTLERNTEAFERNAEAFRRNAEAFERNAEAFERNAEAFERNAEAFRRNAEAFDRNAEALAGHSRTIDALIEKNAAMTQALIETITSAFDRLQAEIADQREQTQANTRALLAVLDRLGPSPGT